MTKKQFNVKYFCLGNKVLHFINTYLKADLYNDLLRTVLALSRVVSGASYTVIPIWRGTFLFKVCLLFSSSS